MATLDHPPKGVRPLPRVGYALLALCGLLAGCTAETPPAAQPAASPRAAAAPAGERVPNAPPFPDPLRARLDDGTPVTLDPAERALTVGDTTLPAGFGPTHVVVGDRGRVYVTDTAGGSVLLFRTRPRLEMWRRAAVPGSPYGTALDRRRGRLWIALTKTNELVRVTADGAPRLRGTPLPTVRQPDAVAVDEGSGAVFVQGAGGEIRRLPSPDA